MDRLRDRWTRREGMQWLGGEREETSGWDWMTGVESDRIKMTYISAPADPAVQGAHDGKGPKTTGQKI